VGVCICCQVVDVQVINHIDCGLEDDATEKKFEHKRDFESSLERVALLAVD
jgi:hypothetical protein